jgi:hypothetical protein
MIIKTIVLSQHKQIIPFEVVQNQHAILMPIGDIHWGVEDFPLSKLKTNIKWAVDRGCVFLGMGDYLDFASCTQRAILKQLRDTTATQIDNAIKREVEDLFEVLRSTKGLWLGILEGNHRWTFQDSTTADQYLCSLLQCDFLGTSSAIRVHPVMAPKQHPEADTIVFCHHGVGSSRKLGGHLNRVEDLMEWFDADLYLMAHSHAKIFAPMDYQSITPDGVHTHRTKLVARTGSFYKGYASHSPLPLTESAQKSRGNYIEEKAYPPSAMGAPCFGIGFEKIGGSRFYKPAIHGSM